MRKEIPIPPDEQRGAMAAADLELAMAIAEPVGRVLSNPRVQGSLQTFGGTAEIGLGWGFAIPSWGLSLGLVGLGADEFSTGLIKVWTGEHTQSMLERELVDAGMSPTAAGWTTAGVHLAATAGTGLYVKSGRFAPGRGFLRDPQTGRHMVHQSYRNAKAAAIKTHRSLNQRYIWGQPPGGHWSQGVGHQTRVRLGLVGTGKELHHWLIPQRARWAPNYMKNRGWNLRITADRAAHARIDTAFSVSGVRPYPLPIRPWMAMPNWARTATVGTGLGLGAGAAYWLAGE